MAPKKRLTQAELRVKLATELKEAGQRKYTFERDLDGAIKLYTEALEILPTLTIVLTCRSNCLFLQNKFQEALTDCLKSIDLNPKTHHWNYIRALQIYLMHGDLVEGKKMLTQFEALYPFTIQTGLMKDHKENLEKMEAWELEATDSLAKKDHMKCLLLVCQMMTIATECKRYKMWHEESLKEVELAEKAASALSSAFALQLEICNKGIAGEEPAVKECKCKKRSRQDEMKEESEAEKRPSEKKMKLDATTELNANPEPIERVKESSKEERPSQKRYRLDACHEDNDELKPTVKRLKKCPRIIVDEAVPAESLKTVNLFRKRKRLSFEYKSDEDVEAAERLIKRAKSFRKHSISY